ncbi:chaperone protein dnaJ 8, chloroplastic isoform X2 [Gossypium hirsutum]|uniref:Chaperone protein dnaJ 8, chloroplastic isoform X2 n=1 Tax=Gossypium hirsutum TaxID=3635 RepID=A0ABM3A3Y6_GOSHI|nr:chaperone protein dnaJ 8, chloroplastic isoform X2 [Gossypium hirsutum]
MASAIGMIGGKGCSSWMQVKEKGKKKMANRVRVYCSSAPSVMDPYKTLRIQPGASESEVKKAFRQLALQILMSRLRGETKAAEVYEEEIDEPMRGMDDSDWDLWEEWMGWEGAGIRDYSSHINPYI